MNTDPKTVSLDEWRKWMGQFLRYNPNSGPAWDILTAQRGPDSPSERGDMSPTAASKAYTARRDRKYKTVEVIRAVSFDGVVGGCARSHKAQAVQLPPQKQWDHFDKHVARAARHLGLTVEIEDEK